MSILDKKWLDEVWEKTERKLARTAVSCREMLPYTTADGKWTERERDWWTNGVWPGTMWLMYDATGKEDYKITAERAEVLMDDALKTVTKLHHDVGFMWHLSAGANYRLTGNKESFVRNMYAANTLAGRYNIKGIYQGLELSRCHRLGYHRLYDEHTSLVLGIQGNRRRPL